MAEDLPKLRLIAMAQALLESGAPLDTFAAGIQHAPPDYVYFDFKITAFSNLPHAVDTRDLP